MKIILICLILITSSIGCKKDPSTPSCYDASIVHDNFCTTDCPGFIGCDDKTYCNSCEAARLGIGPK